MTAAEIVVLGGGVMHTPGLLERTREAAARLDRGYLPGRARHAIVAPALGPNAGIAGAILLAQAARAENS